MSKPLFTILIPTLRCRRALLDRLLHAFRPQLDDRVRILKLEDEGEETTGAKRRRLLAAAATPYVAFFDDDDLPSDDYWPRIAEALEEDPDVVGFRLRQYDDDLLVARAVHSVTCRQWGMTHGEDGLRLYQRTPNHLNPVRTEMAQAVGFPDITFGEDAEYSRRLISRFPDMQEKFIDAELYLYLRRSSRPTEQS